MISLEEALQKIIENASVLESIEVDLMEARG